MNDNTNQISQEKIEACINGRDPMERIVNLSYNYRDDFMTIYYRDENDQKCKTKENFYPFCWATFKACDKLCGGDRKKVKELMRECGIGVEKLITKSIDGIEREEFQDGYRFMFYAKKPMSYNSFLKFFKLAGNPVYSNDKDKDNKPKSSSKQFLVVTPQEQFMISTGKRFFKGYDDYDQVLKLSFDLETEGLDTMKDRITHIGIRMNRPFNKHPNGFEKIIDITGDTDEEKDACELWAIDQMFKVIYTFKPDVITAHNGENFDWNMIINACTRLGTSIEQVSSKYFGGESIRKEERPSILKLGGEIEEYHQTIVPNIVVTDSLHAVRRAQALDSNMLRADLKYVSRYSKIVKPNRVYIPGDKINDILNDKSDFVFNNEDGDWYRYDPNYVQKKIEYEPNPAFDLAFFQAKIDADLERAKKEYESERFDNGDDMTISDYREYGDDVTAQKLYDEYIESINQKNKEAARFKKGKEGDSAFKIYTRNYVAEGYEHVTGAYIVERYLLDDLYECDRVEYRYNTPNFLICKMLPVPYKKCTTMGTAGQWKALLMAWSYENKLAVPMFRESKTFTGGLSRLLRVGFVDNVAKFDYNSLYPSIILTWAISDSNDLMKVMLHFLEHVLTQREKYKNLKKVAGKKADAIKERLQNRDYKTKEEGKELNAEMMKWKSEESFNDKKQLPLKIFGNSFFGSYGAPNVFPWGSLKCAEQTTCTGRQCLRLMIAYFSKLGYQPIVGDSFTEDTPVFIKYNDSGWIDIKPISELIDENEIEIDELGREYDYTKKGYKVLCRSGWVEPSYIYRHKTDKDIYEVTDDDVTIEVTEDHSLFNSKQEKIKPSEINEETELEYYNGKIDSIDCPGALMGTRMVHDMITRSFPDYFYNLGKNLAQNEKYENYPIDRVPVTVLNSYYEDRKEFYRGFMENYRDDIQYSKTCLAGLQYLAKFIRKKQ